MNWKDLVRQTHRWLSIVFTLTVVANFVLLAIHRPSPWVTYAPLPPLFLMLLSGLYMFFRPYLSRERSALGHSVFNLSSRL